MSERPRNSRYRRLPGIFRIGEDKPDDPLLEPQRLTLYVPAGVLDLAEMQARRLGYRDGQEYCTDLVIKAIEAENDREHVADVESKRGPLEGFHAIEADPDYLVELSAAAVARPESNPPPAAAETLIPIGVGFPGGPPEVTFLDGNDPLPPAGLSFAPTPARPETPRARSLSPPPPLLDALAAIIQRHASQLGDDPHGFLPCLRRGESVPPAEVAELAQALSDLERDFRGVAMMDRSLTFSLHRLAFESQILSTDAWPGAFDVWTIDMVRAVQEAVERILSGHDIRYYPTTAADSSPGATPPPPETPR